MARSNWNYHDHGTDSSDPLIWLDGLDLPNLRLLPVHFVEHFNEPSYATKGLNQTASQMIFTGGQLKAGLDEMEVDSATQRYQKADDREVSGVLGGSAVQRLNATTSSSLLQVTLSAVYYVNHWQGSLGCGVPDAGVESRGKFFVPSWNPNQHLADAGATVYLYPFDDRPMITALGFHRSAANDAETLIPE
ncbi:hypothetical protein N7522_011901 [Penicillium canescens]|nr:hypothetical protein N7522_011901 [Penicillium canescens]